MQARNLLQISSLGLMLLMFCITPANGFTQPNKAAQRPAQKAQPANSMQRLRLEIEQLQVAMQQMRAEALRNRAEASAENLQLKQELKATHDQLDSIQTLLKASMDSQTGVAKGAVARASEPAAAESEDQRISKLEESQQLLATKVDEQYQTKVEGASKYRLKLSGLVLMNIISNRGNVDHFEIPGIALPATSSLTGGNTGGSFGATLRQSQLGLEVFGPSVAGARTSGHFVADFLGDYPDTLNGFSAGTLRLRTGTLRLDWKNTSVIGGQDDLFISPVYPTSFASLGIPALSYSGNLWGWVPQLRVEHRLTTSENSTVTFSGGILDPLTGEVPTNEFLRAPGAGESARQPAYGGRVAWSHQVFGQPLTIGIGGYYNRQNWGLDRKVNGWAGTTDWTIPFGRHFDLSGAFYRGEAVGGFGAGAGRAVLVNGPLTDPTTTIKAAQSAGGWAQLKFKPVPKLEFNAAAGQDGIPAREIRGFTFSPLSGPLNSPLISYFPGDLTRNRAGFVNVIYRPRSNLLFSAEYRSLRTFTIEGRSDRANHLNLIMGVLF